MKECHVALMFPEVQQLGVVAGSEAEPVQAVFPFTLTSKSMYWALQGKSLAGAKPNDCMLRL